MPPAARKRACKKQRLAEAALQRGFEFGQISGIEPLMAAREFGKAFEIAAVAGVRHDKRAVERRIRQFPAPQVERTQAEPADDRLRTLALAPRRQHAAGKVAGGEHHRLVAALMQRDIVAGLREQQRLPGAGNAGADDGNGRIPPGRDGQKPALWFRTLIHPCPFAGMTRIRFKGSPRSRLPKTGLERAVSQLLIGAPLGTGLM